VRGLGFSDLHRDLEQARRLVERARDVDVVLCAGDLASMHHGLDETVAVLAAIETPSLLVPGNNETHEELREACRGWAAATVLHGEGVELAGVHVFGLGGGVPVTPWDWSFDLTEEEAASFLDGCPEGAVLLVHSPPRGHVDNGLGSVAVLKSIQAKRPELALCGHVHECWGRESQIGATRVLNLGPAGVVLELG
jgi:Icc-related predicted phosphoesterase